MSYMIQKLSRLTMLYYTGLQARMLLLGHLSSKKLSPMHLATALTNSKLTFINLPLATICFSLADSNFMRFGGDEY